MQSIVRQPTILVDGQLADSSSAVATPAVDSFKRNSGSLAESDHVSGILLLHSVCVTRPVCIKVLVKFGESWYFARKSLPQTASWTARICDAGTATSGQFPTSVRFFVTDHIVTLRRGASQQPFETAQPGPIGTEQTT